MNQGEFAKYLGISRAALSAWENGRAEPSSANIRKILKIFKDNNIELERQCERFLINFKKRQKVFDKDK